MLYAYETRTVDGRHTCEKCGLTMAPQMVRVVFCRETENDPWRVAYFEHLRCNREIEEFCAHDKA